MKPARKDVVLCKAVRDPGSPPLDDLTLLNPRELEEHRLAPAAYAALARAGALSDWPVPVRAALQAAAAAQAVIFEVLDRELRAVLEALDRERLESVLIKGAAVAHTHYHDPATRPRGDTDLVVRAGDAARAAQTLARAGYERCVGVEGDAVTRQSQWRRTLARGLVHTIDLHVEVFNPHAFAGVLPGEELFRSSMRLPALGPGVRAPGPVHALLIACVHRAAHHAGSDDPLWALDIHLIAGGLTDTEAERFAALAAERGVRAVCASALEWAAGRFGTKLKTPLLELRAGAAAREETAAFLEPGRRQVDVLRSDLAAMRGWRSRVRLLRQHLFPSRRYMRERYGVRGWIGLAAAYVWRIAAGAPRWFRRG